MIILKVHKSWKHVWGMPLFRALVLDGAIYYSVCIVAFGLQILAKMSSEVGMFRLYCVQ